MSRSKLSSLFSYGAKSRASDAASKPHGPILTVFDKRRGTREGEEGDKTLAFYPAKHDVNLQKGIVGFAEAAITFTSTFSKELAAESITTNYQKWTLVEVEPCIFMLLVIQKSSPLGALRQTVLQQMLRRAHAAFCLDHGSLQRLLDQDQTGQLARKALAKPTEEMGRVFANEKNTELVEAANPLSQQSGCPTLRAPRSAYSCMQTLLNALLTSYGGKALYGVLVLRDQYLMWSTINVKDTQALYRYAVSTFTTQSTGSSSYSSYTPYSSTKPAQRYALKEAHWRPDAWKETSNGFMALKVPLTAGQAGTGGANGQAQGHGAHTTRFPCFLLSEGEQQCFVVPYCQDGLILLMLIHNWVDPSDDMLSGLAALVHPKASKLASMCSSLLSGYKGGHVPGYRYLYESTATMTVQGSPSSKVATLSRESALLINAVRAALEDKQAHAAASLQARGSGREEAEGLVPDECREVLVGGCNGCWVVVRQAGPRRLTCVMEVGQEHLLGAADATSKFIRYNYNGLLEI